MTERLKQGDRSYMVHMTHCHMGDNMYSCKYGEYDICPALEGVVDPWTEKELYDALKAKGDEMTELEKECFKFFEREVESYSWY